MNVSSLAWSAAWLLAAAVAVVRLLVASGRPEASVRNGYRWLAVATACLGAGATIQQMFGGLVGGGQPLRVADLISLGALPALVIGLATLTGECPDRDRGVLIDSCLLVASLFVIALAAVFGPDYAGSGIGPAAFTLELIRPVADLAALGVLVRFVIRSPRPTILPAAALTALTIGDSLAVSTRISDSPPGAAAHVALIAALALLAGAPLLARPPVAAAVASSEMSADETGAADQALAGPADVPGGRSPYLPSVLLASPATTVALAGAAAAALVVAGFAAAGALVATSGLALTGAIVVLLLVIRLVALTRQVSVAAASAHAFDWRFRALADSTSDVVAVCDLAGLIEYLSPAVSDFGFEASRLAGARLLDQVHPEDRLTAMRAALAGLRTGEPIPFSGRVRSADGSWRHVEATVSRYGRDTVPDRLLVTARDVSDRVALQRQVTQLTFHDGITGLPNRAYLEDLIRDRHEAGGTCLVGLILIDLDGYTAVNDLLGHSGGDVLLAQAGRRLRTAAPADVTVARWGADEFAMLVPDPVSEADVTDLAGAMLSAVAAGSFPIAGKEIPLTASVGVAVTEAGRASQLLGNAHVALSHAKEAGGSRVEVFAARMQAQALRRLELASDLHQALAEHRLAIEYQPIADLRTGRLVGVEAMVCWSRDGKLVESAELLEIAEDAGLTEQIGDWALTQACGQVAARRSGAGELSVSVNVTARQASRPEFTATVLSILAESGLPPHALTLEVTERLLTADPGGRAVAALAELRDRGVALAIDDFGTGYASLANLTHLAVDTIKIAPAFIDGLGADSRLTLLTQTIIELGHDLGIDVVADGIERAEQREKLVGMGCWLGQGPAVGWPSRNGGPPPGAPGGPEMPEAGQSDVVGAWAAACQTGVQAADKLAGG